jgi:predicted alpha/beta-fold hydrolase
MNYSAPWWLPGGNLQTIWAALRARRFEGAAPVFRRERWTTPDDDFVDVDWLVEAPTLLTSCGSLPPEGAGLARGVPVSGPDLAPGRPLLVVFHGLEGSSASHYAEALAVAARQRGWACAVPHFRSCSGEINHAPRAYHSGDFEEIDWMLRRFKARHDGPLLAVGVSLGGNALMRWAGELGTRAGAVVNAIASVCSPLDLTASGEAIGKGFNRLVYTPMFLRTMVPKALEKLDQHPGLFSRDALLRARNLYEFDDIFTAPLHGFINAADYWARASAKPHMHHIGVPALALNALNDPFVPPSSLPSAADVSDCVTLWRPAQGGHVGFPSAPFPGNVRLMPEAVTGFLAAQLQTQE